MITRIAAQTKQNLDSLKLESSTWKEQFHNAMNVNGGDVENATNLDYVMHFLSFFWKVCNSVSLNTFLFVYFVKTDDR
jgi:solute carrier family 8 (sodium/calcium exchanger)